MKKSFIKRKKNNKDSAVSEVVGTILLLGISVTLFSIVYTMILSTPYSPPTPNANIAYSLNDKNLTLTHVGGKPLELNTEVRILINNTLCKSFKVGAYLDANDKYWDMGEQLVCNLSGNINEIDYSVEVQVIDVNSNSIVMMGKTLIKNRSPIICSPDPYNDETSVPRTLTSLNITISDPDNDAFSWTIKTEPNIGSNSGLMQVYTENNFHCDVSGLVANTNYTWYINAIDINGKSAVKTFTFTTRTPTVMHKHPIDINSSNIDSSADIGTETDFTNCKANAT
ncbi:MAG: type IV pilin N-terminal domain-containing protein, partial [Candidatus Thermoplasmatota archaeon]|nr:type IV pilin N-terminal domain-containing protein [Candidatus Thermoplasmatota archaeon]